MRPSYWSAALLVAVFACAHSTDPVAPPSAACEMDRPPILPIAAGESWRLSGDDPVCVSLESGAEYLLTVANIGSGTNESIVEPVVRIDLTNASPSSNANANTNANLTGAASGGRWLEHHAAVGLLEQARRAKSQRPTTVITLSRSDIQATLGTAQVGDRVWIPDRWSTNACGADPGAIPVFGAVVVAVSGSSVILADSRLPNLADITAPTERSRLHQIAATIEKGYLPTMRILIASDFAPPNGANGRIFTLLSNLTFDLGTTILPNEASPRSFCAGSIEASIAVLPGTASVAEATMAGTAIHEHAHGADFWRGPALSGMWLGSRAWGTEALATNAQEQAARIVANTPTAYRQFIETSEVQSHWPATRWPATSRPEFSPLWGNHAARLAAYGTGGLFLLFAREQRNEVWTDAGSGPRLYEQLAASGDWSLAGFAALLGSTPEDLFDRFVLAVALDDRMAPPIASDSRLPQFTTWDNSWRRDLTEDPSWRAFEMEILGAFPETQLSVGAGTYGMWRVHGDNGGVKVKLTPIAGRPASIVRITRYR